MNLETLIKNKKGTIVDVRTPAEFMGGKAADAINIPLGEISERIDELKSLTPPLILCCASGNRSGQASYFLSAQGIECINAGSWVDVNYLQSITV